MKSEDVISLDKALTELWDQYRIEPQYVYFLYPELSVMRAGIKHCREADLWRGYPLMPLVLERLFD